MKNFTKLNKKGLSLVELMVSFSLSCVILVYLLNIVLMLKNLYLINDEKTNIMIKQAAMIKKIENRLNMIHIDSVNTCGDNCVRFYYDTDRTIDLIVDNSKRTIKFDNFKMKFEEGTKLGQISVNKKEISGIDTSKEENNDGIVTFKIPIKHKVLDGEYGIRFTFMYNSDFTDIPDIKPEDFLSVRIKGNIESGKATNQNVTLTATVKPNNSFDKYMYNWQKKENGEWVSIITTEENILELNYEVKNDFRVIVSTQENNTATSNEYNVLIDKTAPKCNVTGGSSSWTNKNVTIKASCQEQGKIQSGCVTDDFSKTYSSEMNIENAGAIDIGKGGSVKDLAGNVTNCATDQIVRIDKTAPTCKSSGGNSSWTNGNRTLTGKCSDTGGSGCTGDVSKNIDYEINGSISPGTVYDNAGNSAVCANQIVKIDKTAPTCKSSGGSSAWTNQSRKITGKCSDTGGSGCTGDVSKNITYETDSWISPGTVEDGAGNTAYCETQRVRIDKTDPECESSGGSNSWTKNSRTLKGTCTDSGGSGCTGNVTKNVSYETDSWISPGTVEDEAGNTAYCSTERVRIDRTPPRFTSTSNSSDGSWTNESVTLRANATDSLSGVKEVEYSLNNSTWYSQTSSSFSKSWTSDIDTTVYLRAEDNAGNVSSNYTSKIRIDKTPPVMQSFDYQYVAPDTVCNRGLVTADPITIVFRADVYNAKGYDPVKNGASSGVKNFTIILAPTYWLQDKNNATHSLRCTESGCQSNSYRYKFILVSNIQSAGGNLYTFPRTNGTAQISNPYYGNTKQFCADWCINVAITDKAGNITQGPTAYGTGTECPKKYNNSSGY